jgi:hypothetical protein
MLRDTVPDVRVTVNEAVHGGIPAYSNVLNGTKATWNVASNATGPTPSRVHSCDITSASMLACTSVRRPAADDDKVPPRPAAPLAGGAELDALAEALAIGGGVLVTEGEPTAGARLGCGAPDAAAEPPAVATREALFDNT